VRSCRVLLLVGLLTLLGGLFCSTLAAQPESSVILLTFSGSAEVSRREGVWDPAHTNQVLFAGDRMRTGAKSRATIRLSDGTTMTIGAEGSFEVVESKQHMTLNPLKGLFYFFHRDKPGQVDLRSKTASAAVRGTEFHLQADEDGTWLLSVLDGEVSLQTSEGSLDLKTGEAGLAKPGMKPNPVIMRRAADLIQWCLYYPAVLDVDELILAPDEREAMAGSLSAYRSGDLSAALARCPFDKFLTSTMPAIYRAELLLSVGDVDQAVRLLAGASSTEHALESASLKSAVEELIAVVKGLARVRSETQRPQTASEWLAESYRLQSESKLTEALAAAQAAVKMEPAFGFGWERVAELEFSFGHVAISREALGKSLALAPRNTQAKSLQGFLFAADNRMSDAIGCFNEAIALDGAHGNAWLGRGLCRIRNGELAAGREDLLVAASLEPQRSVFRSYLGKAFAVTDERERADKELKLAQRLDPHDPTAWLYSALLLLEENRLNEAIAALEKSASLNENRSVFRSRLLLDQDRAVRGANLAAVYQDAGLNEVAIREATRAIETDYANYSAHLFLANSYNALRDPQQVNLRYETAWLSEYLVANLLSPVGAGTLSPMVSQEEYSRLFEQNRVGLSSSTQYSTRGDWEQSAVQYGQFDNWGYAVEETYRSQNGGRPNDDLSQLTLSVRLKQQLTPQDTVYLQTVYYNSEGGDLAPYYDPSFANLTLRVKETQEPLLIGGYHHEWAPGVHTLVLAGRLQDTVDLTNANAATVFLSAPFGPVESAGLALYHQHYHSDQTIYISEIQQLFEIGSHTFIFGGRYQTGTFKAASTMSNGATFPDGTQTGVEPIIQNVAADFQRFGLYGYDEWRPIDSLLIIGGLSYDSISFPENYLFAPVSEGEASRDRICPKAGIVWRPTPSTTIRAGYSSALGGVSFDQSFRLEPSQVAGFNQAFRSIIPEAVAGSLAAPRFDIYGLQFEQAFPTRTYVGITAGLLQSDAERMVGAVEFAPTSGQTSNPFQPILTRQSLNYNERTLAITLNQLISDEFSVGIAYQVSRAQLKDNYPDVPDTADIASPFALSQNQRGTLHQLRIYGLFNHPSGFFCETEGLWSGQDNEGYSPGLRGDDFWQLNLYGGYRWWHRRAELRLALLNVTDQDYHLNPLNLTALLPRQRTLTVSLRFFF